MSELRYEVRVDGRTVAAFDFADQAQGWAKTNFPDRHAIVDRRAVEIETLRAQAQESVDKAFRQTIGA